MTRCKYSRSRTSMCSTTLVHPVHRPGKLDSRLPAADGHVKDPLVLMLRFPSVLVFGTPI